MEISIAIALAFCASMFVIGIALDRFYDVPIRRYLTYRWSSRQRIGSAAGRLRS
jgi:hypothetical protein